MEARNQLARTATMVIAVVLSELASAKVAKPEDAETHIQKAEIQLRNLLDASEAAANELLKEQE